jgi:hypothetical protein
VHIITFYALIPRHNSERILQTSKNKKKKLHFHFMAWLSLAWIFAL